MQKSTNCGHHVVRVLEQQRMARIQDNLNRTQGKRFSELDSLRGRRGNIQLPGKKERWKLKV